jgi:glycine dehydrogenase subunit 2
MVVAEALMMEPTETESKETLDSFADTLIAIKAEDPQVVKTAPHTHIVSRPDEVKAAKELILRWAPDAKGDAVVTDRKVVSGGDPAGMP